ncbi:DUF2922 domain-containing protein [Clostridium bornimense]|uniref:DUF2922 domain-containing protein n=1 Tax=Clostridium bornimense TaxID=1216932 RepID=UPI001C0FBFE6|nr:DUF2922 domain-containing protein [Clostridium bornimense]MBU5317280.1 DUF2922 domain-containing protein [Clostridium bornimense]
MNNVLVLSFIVEDGSKFNIRITDPKMNLSEDEIRDAMEIIKDESSNVFKKRIVAFNGAEFIETVTNNLF